MTASAIWSTNGRNYPPPTQMPSPVYPLQGNYYQNNSNSNYSSQIPSQMVSSNNSALKPLSAGYPSPHFECYSGYQVNSNNGYASSSTASLPSPTDYYGLPNTGYQQNWSNNYEFNAIKKEEAGAGLWNSTLQVKAGKKQAKTPSKRTKAQLKMSPESDETALSEGGGKSRTRRYKTPSPHILRARRQMANARERRRMDNLNVAYEALREVLPAFENGRRLSKMETLGMAYNYIEGLATMLRSS